MATYAQRSLRHQKKSPNYLFWGITTLFILLLLVGSTYVIHGLIQEKKLQAKIDESTKQLLEKIQIEQDQSPIASTKEEEKNSNVTSIVYLPQKTTDIPFEVSKADFTELLTGQKKKLKQPRQAILIGQVANESVTEQLGAYTLKVDTYVWHPEKETFVEEKEATGQVAYYLKENGQSVTGTDLVESQANLLGIQQVIQQKILDEAKEPAKIIDAVLDMPRISLDDTLTYTPDHLDIQLPENGTGISEISLSYDEIRPFIQTALVDPQYLQEIAAPLEEEKKYVALTFDDGPNPATTPELLAILEEKEVDATFFMLGQNVESYPDIVKEAYEDGNIIASHSYSHQQLNAISADDIKAEVRKTDKAIFEACGILPRLLRPPYGAIDAPSAEIIGKPIIQWDVDSYDWESKERNATIRRINDTVFPGGIILMHDIHPSTVSVIGEIIDNLRTSGYEIVTTEQLLNHTEKPLFQYFGQKDAREI